MRRLVGIQALRALAALSVAVLHALYERRMLAADSTPPGWVDRLPFEAGVDVFFVISGFVMVVASATLFGRRGAPARFLAHRIARIVPLYWLVTALYLGLAWMRPGLVGVAAPEPAYVMASLAFWPAARPDGTVVPLFSLGWTLNYEMLFYALFAAALLLPVRRALATVALALLGLVAVRAAGAPLPFAFWGDPIVLEFALGTALGLLRISGVTLSLGWRAGLIGLGCLAFGLQETGAAWRALAYGGPALLLVAGAGLGPLRRTASETPPVRILALFGDASYALYLTHPFALRGLREVWTAAGFGSSGFVPAALLLALATSLAVHLAVERPLTARARAWLEPQRPERPLTR